MKEERNYGIILNVSFREYMELYLTCDVLILADCFESFRELSLKHGLDPAHYISN